MTIHFTAKSEAGEVRRLAAAAGGRMFEYKYNKMNTHQLVCQPIGIALIRGALVRLLKRACKGAVGCEPCVAISRCHTANKGAPPLNSRMHSNNS